MSENGQKRSRQETRSLLRRFTAYYKPHKVLFAKDMAASILVAVIGVIYPMITRTMLNQLIPDRNYTMIILLGGTLLLLYLMKMLLNYFIQYQGHMMGVYMQAQMRTDLFGHLETLPYRFYDNHETGKIMSRMTNDLFDVVELAHHGPENLIISSLSIIISFTYHFGNLLGGVGNRAGLPVHIAVGLHAVHAVHLGVVVDLGQLPAHFIAAGDNQRMVQHARFGLGEGGIAGVHVVGDGLGGYDHIGEFLIRGDQIGIVVVVAVRISVGVVSLGVVVGFLAQEVDRIGEVSAPAVDEEGSLA